MLLVCVKKVFNIIKDVSCILNYFSLLLYFNRIAGPRGIPHIHKCLKDAKFRGKGHEKEDLDILMKHLEHWAHRLYPRYPFNNVLEQIEKLGFKKPVKVRFQLFSFFSFQTSVVITKLIL